MRFLILSLLFFTFFDLYAVDPIGTYRIKNVSNGTYLSAQSNGLLKTESGSFDDSYEWRFAKLASGFYNIDNLKEGQGVLDNDNNGIVKWVSLEPLSTASDKEWELIDLNDGTVRINSTRSNRGLLIADSLGNVSWSLDTTDLSIWELEDIGKGIRFEPWDQIVFSEYYNSQGELTKTIPIDSSVWFGYRDSSWSPVIASTFEGAQLFSISKGGILIDGNNLEVDGRQEALLTSNVTQLWQLGDAAFDGNVIPKRFIFYNAPVDSLVSDSTFISDLHIQGFHEGFRSDRGTNHPLSVRDCSFVRCEEGLYVKGTSAVYDNLVIAENNNYGVYSGSKSTNNIFKNCTFRDNTIRQNNISWADFVGDTYWRSALLNNSFLGSSDSSVNKRLIGISVYRNAGEADGTGNPNIREQMPNRNSIRGNSFTGYTVGIHQGSRMGRNSGANDAAREGRDYAFYDTIQYNQFIDTEVGIKVNTEANTVQGNTFQTVSYPVVIQCVFFELDVSIFEQQDDDVHIWYLAEDYPANTSSINYDNLFDFQASDAQDGEASDEIDKNEKKVTVHTESAISLQPNFIFSGPDSILNVNPTAALGFLENFRVGSPIDTAQADFTTDLDGLEIAAIYDERISEVNGQKRYSILVFDENGTEINRAGKSGIKWGQITVGDFDFTNNNKKEIAAVPATLGKKVGQNFNENSADSLLQERISVAYPVFLFQRGFEKPMYVRYIFNANKNVVIGTADAGDSLIVVGDIDTLATYRIRSKAYTNNFLKSIANNDLEIAGFSESTNRQWQFSLTDDGFFNIDSRSGGRGVLEVDSTDIDVLWSTDEPKETANRFEWEIIGDLEGYVVIKSRLNDRFITANSSDEVFLSSSITNASKWFLDKIEIPSAQLSEGKIYRLFNEYSSTYLTANDKSKALKNISKEFELRAVNDVNDDFNLWSFTATGNSSTAGTVAYNIDNEAPSKGMIGRDSDDKVKWFDVAPIKTVDSLVWEVWTLSDGQIRIKRSDTTRFLGPNPFNEIRFYGDTTALTKWKLIEVDTTSSARVTNAQDQSSEVLGALNKEIMVYPVPSRGVVIMDGIVEGEEITVFDLGGNKVFSKESGSESSYIDLSKLEPGVYIIKTKNSSHRIIIE